MISRAAPDGPLPPLPPLARRNPALAPGSLEVGRAAGFKEAFAAEAVAVAARLDKGFSLFTCGEASRRYISHLSSSLLHHPFVK